MIPIELNIEKGGTSEKVAAGIDGALKMTSKAGLTNMVNQAGLIANNAVEFADTKSKELVNDLITMAINELNKNGAIDELNKGIDAATTIIGLLAKALVIAGGAVTVAGNIANLTTNKCGTLDINVVPSPKGI